MESTNLSGALFENANLERADFSGAVGARIGPTTARLKDTIVSQTFANELAMSLGVIVKDNTVE